jgi:hypothetical protein
MLGRPYSSGLCLMELLGMSLLQQPVSGLMCAALVCCHCLLSAGAFSAHHTASLAL